MSKAGNRGKLFEDLARDYSSDLYRFAFWQSGEAEVAEDLVQETFYQAWRSIGSLRDPEKGRAWLFQILRHRYAHWIRARGRRPFAKVSMSDVEDEPNPEQGDALTRLARRDLLQKALTRLDDRYKEPFLMVFLGGFSCRETADILKIPLGTVLSRVHRARVFLRKALAGLDSVGDQQHRVAGDPGTGHRLVRFPGRG